MLYGINITSFKEWHIAKTFYEEGVIDFVEILIDNFRNSDPKLFLELLEGLPHSVHIMFSRFLEVERSQLGNFFKLIKPVLDIMNPLYVSDHIARFKLDGIEYPISLELDYKYEYNHIIEEANYWSKLLGTKLYLETFPSILDTGLAQAEFFNKMLDSNHNLGVLFDISNLLIAQLNGVNDYNDWKKTIKNAKHFHIAGYFQTKSNPPLVMDGHNRDLSDEALDIVRTNKHHLNKEGNTIVIERDYYYDIDTWRTDILKVKEALA